jgi:hypothetical protein
MRLMLGVTFGLAALTGLTACGQSEESLRNTTRELMLVGCRNAPAADRAALAQTGVNVDQYCTCAVDRTVRSLTSEQLKQISRNPNAVPGMDAAAAQCMSELMPGAGTAGNEAAGNNSAPAAPEAPAAEDGEAAEGNETAGQ